MGTRQQRSNKEYVHTNTGTYISPWRLTTLASIKEIKKMRTTSLHHSREIWSNPRLDSMPILCHRIKTELCSNTIRHLHDRICLKCTKKVPTTHPTRLHHSPNKCIAPKYGSTTLQISQQTDNSLALNPLESYTSQKVADKFLYYVRVFEPTTLVTLGIIEDG